MPGMGTKTIGDRVRELRGDTSRAELSRQTGIPATTIQTLEEQPQQSNKWLPVLARHFNVNLEWLATGRGPKYATESQTASQSTTLDLDILHEALTLMHHDELHGGPYVNPRAYTRRLAELYARVAADGGRLTDAHNVEFTNEVQARVQGAVDGAKAGTGRRNAGGGKQR